MLLNMASKVFCKVILERINMLDAKLREVQAGFRAGRSCMDQITTLRIIVEQSIEWQSSLYINFTDFEKYQQRSFVEVVAALRDACQGGYYPQSSL